MIADVFEVLPRRHRGEPTSDFANIPICPVGVHTVFVDMPIVGRCDDTAVGLRCTTRDRMCLERIQPDSVLRTVWFTESIREINSGTVVERSFQLIREHPFPADLFSH